MLGAHVSLPDCGAFKSRAPASAKAPATPAPIFVLVFTERASAREGTKSQLRARRSARRSSTLSARSIPASLLGKSMRDVLGQLERDLHPVLDADVVVPLSAGELLHGALVRLVG